MPGQERPSPAGTASHGLVLAVDGRTLWYDVGRNGLWSVDPVLAEALPLLGDGNHRDVAARLAVRHGPAAAGRAVAEIASARRDEGLFLTRRPRVRAPGPRRAPARDLRHLILCLTERCNLACRYCPRAGPAGGARRTMPAATALRAVRWFADHAAPDGVRHVSLYGGEPLMRPALVRAVVRAVRRLGPPATWRIVLDTNLTRLDDATAALLARAGVHLQVSLDGPPAVHDRHRVGRDGAGSHAAVTAGLRRLLRADPTAAARITFRATVTAPWDLAGVAAAFDDFAPYRALGLPPRARARLGLVDPAGAPADVAVPGPAAALARARRRYLDALRAGRRDRLPAALLAFFDEDLIRFHHRSRGPLPDVVPPPGACRPGVRRTFVACDGTLLACERVSPDLRLGHLDGGLRPGLVRRCEDRLAAALGDRCGDCWALRMCRVCLAALGPGGGTGRLDAACAATRRGAREVLATYAALRATPGGLDFLADTTVL